MADDISRFLEEDIGDGDITTNAVVGDQKAVGTVKAKSACTVAGLAEAEEVFSDMGLHVKKLAYDGSQVEPGTIVMRVEGSAKAILTSERLALNFIMLMSGIATATDALVKRARTVNPNIRIAGTRKTTPGFRRYEKKAIILGGGDPHRFRLDDQILIKDNHLKMVGSVTEAVRRAKRFSFSKKVEVEAETLAQAEEAAKAGADSILLDNMSSEQVAEAYAMIKGIHSHIAVEVSGGIRPENIAQYAKNADVISVGYITHSAPAADFSMDIEEAREK
jgi:nicotinate-nucleotide pyrophosphorylase (carboxylating)